MRDVKSRNYFEQMKGRGTRTLDADSLKGYAVRHQRQNPLCDCRCHRRYEIIENCQSATDYQAQCVPERPGHGVMMGVRDEDTVSSLAGRLARLEKQLDPPEQHRIADAAGGTPLPVIIGDLLNAINPDTVEKRACEIAQLPEGSDPGGDARNQARDELVGLAANVFTGELIELIDSIRRDKEQTIVHDDLDTLTAAGWAGDTTENAKLLTQEFAEYLNEHRDDIDALNIYFQTPARRSEVSYAMIKALLERLRQDRLKLAPLRVWQAYAYLEKYQGDNPVSDLTALVALVRRVCWTQRYRLTRPLSARTSNVGL